MGLYSTVGSFSFMNSRTISPSSFSTTNTHAGGTDANQAQAFESTYLPRLDKTIF